MDARNEHKIPLETLFETVGSSIKGLSSTEATARLERYGRNILLTREKAHWILQYLRQFKNFFAILLLIGSLLAGFADWLQPGEGNLYIAIALLGVVFLNATFTFIQQYQSERILESFQKMLPDRADVFRDGERRTVLAEEIVPGDILVLEEGDKIPADGRLIAEEQLKVDHAALTGESEPKLRTLECTHDNLLESRNMIFSGTLVQSGHGRAVIYATGMRTEIGSIVQLTKETEAVSTPLHRELQYFIRIISGIAVSLGILFFLISLWLRLPLMGSMIFAIGIIVANVPEGLLPTVTLCLTLASKRMAKKKALLKNLEAVETLGSTTVICTDKTGTLTENKMSIQTLLLNLREWSAAQADISKMDSLHKLIEIMVLCNNAHRNHKGLYRGDPTETSLMNFVEPLADIEDLRQQYPRIQEFPFDSKTKRMITTHNAADQKVSYLKGAPEVVLNASKFIVVDGRIIALTPELRQKLRKDYERLASRGERVLGFAYGEGSSSDSPDSNFILVGFAGMRDPYRPEIPQAIRKCHSAGIRVVMITGDAGQTAIAIARQVGMIPAGQTPNCITGDELAQLDDIQLQTLVNKDPLIFARINPRQKLRIVQALQNNGEVVTVTGDGVNDAPALKNADMGVAMGLIGTEVAREASDMVLLDDNFATIVTAVEEGRTVFANIKKFIAYILTSNIPEILPFIAFVLLPIPLPLTVVLILSIDLGTDLLPALGLGIERPESDVMQQPPRARNERLLTRNLLFMSYGIVGMLQAAAGFFAFFYILFAGGWNWGQTLAVQDPLYLKAVSGFFASIIICQIPDVIICRTRRQSLFKVGLLRNKLVLAGIATELVLLLFIVYPAPCQKFFGTHSLSLTELFLSLPFALVIFLGDELRRVFVRRNNRFVLKYLAW